MPPTPHAAVPALPAELHDLHRRMALLTVEQCPQSPGFVSGVGDPAARLCVVGEAPAEYEVREGVPFSGPAGKVLDELLEKAGIKRRSVWLTNVVKCRTMKVVNGRKENRAPLAGELKAWLPLLQEELAVVRPCVILCLGATAAKAIIGKGIKVTEQRGQWFDLADGARAMITFHPAYIIHLGAHDSARADDAYATLLDDLRRARAAVEEV